jgi:GntR family transcriptional regulator, transcriptional repressor for pyruvate dehydrogenase complex
MEAQEKSEQGSRIVGEIVSLIQQRGYFPGERLPSERDLAERFSVGRAAVREAVTTLESMRYVERRRGSGIFFCRKPDTASLETLVLFSDLGLPMDPKVNADCVEVRRIIEVQAVALACERRTDEDLRRLDATLATFWNGEGFAERASEYDYEFHMAIFRATHNDVLVRIVNPFYIMSKERRLVFFADQQRRKISHKQHMAMTKAIRDKDPGAATKLMATHTGRVEKYFST